MKIWTITSGTCYDCSWDPLILPAGMDLDDENRLWRDWYKQYCSDLNAGKRPKYIDFIEHLKNHGAREPTPNELEIYEKF